jgi:hypothetical protein
MFIAQIKDIRGLISHPAKTFEEAQYWLVCFIDGYSECDTMRIVGSIEKEDSSFSFEFNGVEFSVGAA